MQSLKMYLINFFYYIKILIKDLKIIYYKDYMYKDKIKNKKI